MLHQSAFSRRRWIACRFDPERKSGPVRRTALPVSEIASCSCESHGEQFVRVSVMPASSTPGGSKPKRDSTALALMVAMVVAVAVTGGASLSSVGSGAFQDALRALGFGRESEIAAEQRKQATVVAEMERILSRMDNEIGALTTRVARTESNEADTGERLAKVDGSLTALGSELKEVRARAEVAGEPRRKPVDHLNAAVTGT